jgi:prolyl oligopeptidase
MRRTGIVFVLCLLGACAGQQKPAPEANPPPGAAAPPAAAQPKENAKSAIMYPKTRRDEVKDKLFGVEVEDPYRWLEKLDGEGVREWMDAQDRLARDYLAQQPPRERLAKRLKELFYVDSISPPRHRGGRLFYSRTHADKEKAVYYWREGESGAEHVLLDPNAMSADGSISVGVVSVSYDGKRVAYQLKANNSDEATLHVIDVQSGKVSDLDTIEGAKYAHPSWTARSDGFYYTWIPPVSDKVTVADRPGFAELRFHKLGTDPRKDPIVFPATGNPQTFLHGELSEDGHWLFAYVSHGWNSTDVFVRDMRSAKSKFQHFVVGLPARFEVDVWKDKFYVLTNHEAPRYKVWLAEPGKGGKIPEMKDWKEIVAEDPGAVCEELQVVGEHLILTYLRNASSELEVHALDGKELRKVELPGIGASYGMTGNPGEDTAYYAFASFTQPMQVWRTSVKKGGAEVWAEVKLPIDPSPYQVEQVWYPSKDGTKVSMFIVRRKDLVKNGSTPFLLYGYGGFNVSLRPAFSSSLYPWLEAGGGYAVPNLRGGGEYGEDWHKAGMGTKKQNVFDDFIAAAEYLVKEKYTAPQRLAIRGGSNGGLLVGAAMTQRPDLFRAVVCAVPLLDMVRFHLFGSGKTWIPEYGSAENEEGFKTLFAYSPYHHVKPGTAYPALLMMSADSDDRVDPMHARKMAAAVQAASSSSRPVLLRIEKHAGHGGADLVKQAVEQMTDTYAFLLAQLGR